MPNSKTKMFSIFKYSFCFHFLYLIIFLHNFGNSQIAASYSEVKSLPGFGGPLPFHLETGYIGVDESEDVQLFYYFVKSESANPEADPLVLWVTGGPGCTSFTALMYEIGRRTNTLTLVQHRSVCLHTILDSDSERMCMNIQAASIIFLDLPVGTGFSFRRTSRASHSSDIQACDQALQFLRKWLIDHPKFILNPVYVGGDSYSGLTVPVIVQMMSNGNEAGIDPLINLKGYLLGNPMTFPASDGNYAIPFAHGMALISDGLYESDGYRLSYSWIKDDRVQEALHIRKGSIGNWMRCSDELSYTQTISESFHYHLNLSTKGYRSLIYSGDHDMIVPFLSTEAWIRSLNYSIVDDWRSWIVEGQVGGYTRTYSNGMTYMTVKGGGHTAPEYRPKECSAMFNRWIGQEPL